MKKATFLLTLLTVGMFAGAGAVFAEEGTTTTPPPPSSASSQHRALDNPFDKILEEVDVLTALGEVKPFVPKMKSFVGKVKSACVKLEIPATDGCPDAVKSLNAAISDIETAIKDEGIEDTASLPTAFVDVMKDSFNSELKSLSDVFESQYGGDERAEAVAPTAKPADLYDPKKYPKGLNQASLNPFDPLLEWVEWWDKGSWYIKAIRSNSSIGAPKVIALVKSYCEKFELRDTDGCTDEVKSLKDVVKSGRMQKEARDTIFSTFKTNLQYLSDKFESEFGDGEDAVGGHPLQTPSSVTPPEPMSKVTGNPFTLMLEWVDWWKAGKVVPGAIRTKYGPQLLQDLAAHCGDFAADSGARDNCKDSVSKSPTESGSLYRLFKQNRATKETKDTMISGMKSDLEHFRDNWVDKSEPIPIDEEPDTIK